MADNKIEILTSNAKQVINDYVLGTDTDFQKVENAIQELAENDISTLNWNSLENYPDRSHDYQFSYNNSDGTINIWDTESESYLSPSEFLLSEHSDRQMACDQYAQHRLQFLENTPEALRDCVSNIFQTLKDYHLDVTILSVPNKTGSLDGKDFFAFDVSGGREQIFHSQTGTSIGLKEFQETLEQLQFWDHEEDSTSDERINRILDAAADNPARLRMEVNFLFDDKIQPNGVDFDENASITWTIRGNHETETFILTRDPDTHEITAYEANHGVLNIEQLQEEASRIGVADVSLSNRVTSDEYTQLDHMQTMEKASAKATISAVTMERGLRGMGSLTWHMHGTNGQEDFSLDGNRDGSPIIRDKAGKEYDIDSMYNKLEDIGYFKTADPAPVDMYALPAREELPTYNSLFNFFPPEVRKNMDADEVKEIRASNPYYGIVDGIDMTRKTIPIHVDNATIRNLLGESYQDATIDRMSVSTQYGNYISIEGVKFGITDRIYLDGDITKKDGEKEHINAQYAIRADGVYDDILKSEKSYTFDEIKEKFMDLKENTMDKVEKNTPENSTADSEKSESGIEKNRQYNLMTRAEVNLEGQLHLTQEKVEALEVQAEKIASSKGTSIEVEKGNLIQETFEKIKPYLSGLKELQGKMEGMQDRIGDSRLLRSNTFYQDYKMQYDFCAKKALDLGAAYGKDQVIKNYISNNDLRMDRQEYYKTNYYTSLEQRILSGGQEGLEKYETENGKSYTYGTKYDLSAWEKVGNFFASTIFRPYFRNIEKTIDRDPHAKVAYETVPAVENPEENPVDTSSMVSGGAQGGVTTENQAADGMDSKNSEESGALADEKKAEEEQHMDLKDAIERENQDTKDDAMVAEQTRMESQDNDQDNMTEAANSKDNSESVVNGEEVHEIPESDVLETAEISSADEDVTADFEISQSRDEPESDSGAMPESLDVQDRQEELLIGSVGEDHSDSDSFSTADAKNDTFEPTTDDATLERGESQAESPTIGSENANSFHEEYKAQFSDCLNAANALDDVLSQAIEDVFSDENLGYMDIVNAAADAITDHYNSDTPYSEAAESSADLVYEVTDLDGKPMDNMDTMAEKLQQNGLSAEHVDHLYELASDRYASPEEPFEQPDPYEGFMDLDSGVTDSVDRVDMSQSSSVDAQQKLDFYEPNQFLDQMSNDLDSYVQAIEHAENIGTDVSDTALSDIVGSSFSVDSLKSAIDLMEAEVKSTADDDRDAQETMDTDPVLSEDIPESSIEPEVDDSLDADEWRRYL